MEIRLLQQHHTFVQVPQQLNKAQVMQKVDKDRHAELYNISVGDNVLHRKHVQHSKLDMKWVPCNACLQLHS